MVAEHAWKEKEYIREQAKLDKMVDRCQSTWIERAFTATTTSADIPTSSINMSADLDTEQVAGNNTAQVAEGRTHETSEQGQGTLPQLNMIAEMLRSLQANTNANLDEQSSICHRMEAMEDKLDHHWDVWHDSDDEEDNKPSVKPTATLSSEPNGNAQLSGTQAKLAKELIKLALTYKVPKLIFNEKATKCRYNYQQWIAIVIFSVPFRSMKKEAIRLYYL